jgi:hypothetical protein
MCSSMDPEHAYSTETCSKQTLCHFCKSKKHRCFQFSECQDPRVKFAVEEAALWKGKAYWDTESSNEDLASSPSSLVQPDLSSSPPSESPLSFLGEDLSLEQSFGNEESSFDTPASCPRSPFSQASAHDQRSPSPPISLDSSSSSMDESDEDFMSDSDEDEDEDEDAGFGPNVHMVDLSRLRQSSPP